ncbi:hypothetical protein JTB14_013451 [Gonioctena quinquepunctata]|nr:hypothetical protein JTB14_013451 [Gonioctena quinquepunctata]
MEMETETLTNYEHNQDEHLEDRAMDVANELDSPQNRTESSDSIESSKDNKSPQSKEKENSNEVCDQPKSTNNENEIEEAMDQESGRIEAESDEDCEEEEKLMLSPTHSDKDYDTDEEDDRDPLSADENKDEDSDEEDDKKTSEVVDKTIESEKIETSDSPMNEESKLEETLEDEKDEEFDDKKTSEVVDKSIESAEIEKSGSPMNAESKLEETVEDGKDEDIDEKDEHKTSEVVEKTIESEEIKTSDSAINEDGKDEEISKHEERKDVDNAVASENETDPLGEHKNIEDPLTCTADELAEERNVKEDEKSGTKENDDAEKTDGNESHEKTVDEKTVEKEEQVKKSDDPEETADNKDDKEKVEEKNVEMEASEGSNEKDKEKTEPDKLEKETNESTEVEKKTDEEGKLDYPLLKETLTKPVEGEQLRGEDEDVDMDEDFDPSLLCPELSMEVDEAPVITNNYHHENDGSKSPLRLYEPIFSTFVDEITGAEVDFELTEEERRLKEQTYGEKNQIQFTKIHCTACNVHLGSALDGQGNRFVHPLLKVLICKKCYHFYTSGEFEKDEDGSELYCRWCGQGGQVMCCGNCEMVFCKKCIRINFDRKKIAAIRDSDDWLCFRCNPSQLIHLRIHCSEFMDYVQREMSTISSHENPAAAMTKDFCQCCIPQKKKAPEPTTGEPKRKKRKLVVDPDYDPTKDVEPPPNPLIPASSAIHPTPQIASTSKEVVPVVVTEAAKSAVSSETARAGTPLKPGQAPAGTPFRVVGPGHQPRPRVQVQTPSQAPRATPSPGFIKILPGGVRVPGNAPNRLPSVRPPALRPLRPNVPQMKHEWFEKTVRAAARVNSNLSYTLTQLNRAQASATSVEALAVVHNKLQEILSTSINSLIQIRKNLRTEFIAGIKNIRFPPKPAAPAQPSTSTTQDDDVIFVSPTTSPVPPSLASPSVPAAAMNLPASVTLTKRTSPSTSGIVKKSTSLPQKAGPSGVVRAVPSTQPRAVPSTQPKASPSTSTIEDGKPKSFLRVKSFSALQNVPSECITIPDDPPEPKVEMPVENGDDDDDDVTIVEKPVEVVTIIDDSPMKSPEEPRDVLQAEVAKKDLLDSGVDGTQQLNGLTNGNDEAEEDKTDESLTVNMDMLDPVEKKKILNTKILLRRSSAIEELVKTKFLSLNGDADASDAYRWIVVLFRVETGPFGALAKEFLLWRGEGCESNGGTYVKVPIKKVKICSNEPCFSRASSNWLRRHFRCAIILWTFHFIPEYGLSFHVSCTLCS